MGFGRLEDTDALIRAAAIRYVADATNNGEIPISWRQLIGGFTYEGEVIPLVSQQGIFKPKRLALPISIRTTPPRPDRPPPYLDQVTEDGFVSYAYRGTRPDHHENVWLRRAMDDALTLLYLEGITAGLYHASPAAIVADHPAALRFHVALIPFISTVAGMSQELIDVTQRRYYLQLRAQRAHQAIFRANVLRAYRTRCTVCSLGHAPFLDAAHIIADRDGGEPVIPNGLAMCKIHHAAFDVNILGIRPDLVAEIRHDILEEHDGPMLQHGIQGIHGRRLVVPRRPEWRPDTTGLEQRYERFRDAS